nr:cilia- and flagella-associated protein 91-like [Aegilops tauschii subsp. strangulata]
MIESEGLKASDLLAAFVERRVLPLQAWPLIISNMSGHRDPCRMSTKVLPDIEVVRMVNFFLDCRLLETEWRFGKPPYSRANPPPACFPGQTATDALAPCHPYLADRAESDVDDHELGAASMEEDDATGGGGEGAGGSSGGGLGEWPDDDEGDDEPRRTLGADRTGASSLAAPTAVGVAPKHRADAGLFGSQPKKTKTSATATKWQEAVAKAALFQKAQSSASWCPQEREAVARAKVEATEAAQVEANTAANTQADEAAKAQADEAAKAQADAAAKAQADAAAKVQAGAATNAQEEEASCNRAPESTSLQRTEPSVPEGQAPTGGAGVDQSALERGGGGPVVLAAEVPRRTPTAHAPGSRPEALPVPPSGSELVVGPTPTVRVPPLQRLARVISAPRPMESGPLAHRRPTPRPPVPPHRIGRLGAAWVPEYGRAGRSGPVQHPRCHPPTIYAGVLGNAGGHRDYHNLRMAAYNSQNQELAKRTTDLNQSGKAAAELRKRLGEFESALHTKQQERSQAAQECDRLAKELADQAERHKAELQKLKESEGLLEAEFETQLSNWAEKEKFLSDDYGEIEDMIDGELLLLLNSCRLL